MTYSESSTLFQLYKKQLSSVESIAVFPNITSSSKFNPYLSQLYKEAPFRVYSPNPLLPSYLLNRKKTILHYNWFQFQDLRGVLVLFIKLLPILLFIALGGKVIWTVHNVTPHQKKYLPTNRFLRRLFAKVVSHICVHSESARALIASELHISSKKIAVIPHPPYDVARLPQQSAKESLKKIIPQWMGKKSLLMYGYIDTYKGIDTVIKSFKESSYELIIAGKIKDEAYGAKIEKVAETLANVHLIPRFITDEEEKVLFSAVDGVLFNFTEILTSGSMILAASYGVPIFSTPCDTALPQNSQCHIFRNTDELLPLLENTL